MTKRPRTEAFCLFLYIFRLAVCKYRLIALSLHRVFHGIRFKVNGRRSSGDALLFLFEYTK